MPLDRQDAERGLNLLWEFLSVASRSECTQGFSQAISGLHLFLTDVLPASRPCIRAKVEGGFIEIHPSENTPIRLVDLEISPGEKLGLVLDSVNVEGVSGVSPIVVSLVSAGSVAARDRRLGRGDQLLEINGHSLKLATLERARWLLDSAARQGTVSLAILPSGLLDGLKHSISRQDLLSLTPLPKHKRSRSLDNINKVQKQPQALESAPHTEVKRSKTDVATKNRPQFGDLRYTPSIGSRSSKRSVVSSTVEVAAHLARSSMSENKAGFKKRKVRKMHIMKETSGLGIRIVGGKGSKLGDMGIFVNQLEEGGAAYNDGRLKPGDELLMVDGKSLVGLTHTEAVDVLKASQRLVQLVVATKDNGDSRFSSTHSIPELIGGPRKGVATREVAPELVGSPNRTAFEMTLLRGESVGAQPSLTAETEFTNEIPSSKPQVIRTLTSWGPDSEPLPPPPESPIKTIVFIRSPSKSLGFSIAGGKGSNHGNGIYVRNMDPTGPAAQDGRLGIGDEILEVNSQQLKGCTHQDAADVIKGLKSDVVTMVVRSSTGMKRSPSEWGTEMEVVLEKLPKKPLGIQLAETQEGDKCTVYVRNMASGSVAEMSGKLVLFDQIVQVNGASVLGQRTHEVRGALTAAPAGELRVGVVRPKDPAAVEKMIIEQEKLKKTDNSGIRSRETTPTPAAVSGQLSGNSDKEERVSETEQDEMELMGSSNLHAARSRLLGKAGPRLSLDDALHLQQGDPAAVKALNRQLKEKVTEAKVAAANGSPPSRPSPPSQGSPLLTPTYVTTLTPPQGFTQLELTLKKPQRSRLGINLIETKGSTKGLFMIRRIMPGGVAARDGRLQLGDQLAELNGKSLQGLPLAKVLQEINNVPKYCHFVVWRDPTYTQLSSHGGSRASLASTDDETLTKKGDNRRHLSQSYELSPLTGLKRFSLDLANSPSKARQNQTNREESPLRFKRWSASEGMKANYADIDTSSLDKYFPLTPSKDDELSSGSVTPVPSPPAAQPPSLPGTPIQTPPQTPPSTPPLPPSTPPSEIPALPTTLPPMEAVEEPQLPSSLPTEEDEPPSPSSLPPVGDEPQLSSALPPVEDLPQPPTSLPPEEEPKLPTTLPPEEDLPQPPTSLPPIEDLPQPPTSLPPEDEPQPPTSLPPVEDMPKAPTPLPPKEEPQVPTSLPPMEDLPRPPTSLPPMEDLPQPPTSTPPAEDLPQPPTSLPPKEEPQILTSLPLVEDNQIATPSEETTKSLPTVEEEESSTDGSSNKSPPLPSTLSPATKATPSSQSDLSGADDSGDILKGKRQEGGPFEITLFKSIFKLGLQLLVDQMGMIAVKKIAGGSVVARNGNIKVGDQILSVNDTSFVGKPLSECEKFLKSLPKGQVRFVAMAPPKDVTGGGVKSDTFKYKGVSVSNSGRQLVTEEGVVKVELYCYDKQSLGLEIEGGTDTPLQYVFIKSVVPGSPAFESGAFRMGDQLVMIGNECMIGLTHKDALGVINSAKDTVEVVAQRKESPRQTRKPDPTPTDPDPKRESPEQVHQPIAPAPMKDSRDEELEEPAKKPDIPTSSIPDLKDTPELLHKPSTGIPSPNSTSLKSKEVTPSTPPTSHSVNLQNDEFSAQTSTTPEPALTNKKDSPEQVNKPALPVLPVPDLPSSDSENKKSSPKETHKPSVSTSPIPIPDSPDSDTKKTKSPYKSSKSVSALPVLEVQSSSLPGSDIELSDNRGLGQGRIKYLTSPSHSSTKTYSASDLRKSRGDVAGTFDVVPEETLTIDLHRSASEKMGLAITGGSDNPRLKEVHVKQVVVDCVAHKDGRLKRGDRIVSVNGQSLAGLTNKEALKILKEAGLDVTLVVARKIGRRTSAMNTPYMSTFHSRRGSGENSQQGSNPDSRHSSPPPGRKRRQSSGENSRGGSKGSSPKPRRMSTITHRRRESISFGDKGETSTLPRQLSSTLGVRLVELQKGPTGVGMQLQGGKDGTKVPVSVKSVFPGGSAYKSGKIRTGDVILEANGISFEDLSHEQAIAAMKGFPQGKITLIVRDRSVAAAGH